jgi:hypothetical protein
LTLTTTILRHQPCAGVLSEPIKKWHSSIK